MKKLLALCGSIATMLLFTPLTILAAESGESSTATVPIWLCIPFAGLLLCIAVLPLVKPEWWEKNQPLAVAVWSLLFIIPFAVTYSAGDAVETVLECILNDYLTFIVLLFGLFCVAGNITRRRSRRFPARQRNLPCDRYLTFQLYRYNRCQYVNGTSDDQDELLASAQESHYGIFYLPDLEYGRMLNPDR